MGLKLKLFIDMLFANLLSAGYKSIVIYSAVFNSDEVSINKGMRMPWSFIAIGLVHEVIRLLGLTFK